MGGSVNDDGAGFKVMRLQYAGRCRICGAELSAGVTAVYDRESRTVRCLTCAPDCPSLTDAANITSDVVSTATDTVQMPIAAASEVFAGDAGASARREHDRRSTGRETRIRDAHPVLGGLILALSDDPQTTKAWSVGAEGEERLGRRLDNLVGESIRVLHDRRIPRTRANIDHIVVAPSGVFVIDAKKYKGRPNLRVEGGLFRPRVETLIVGSRNCTRLVEGVLGQVDIVTSALEAAGQVRVPVRGMLCFVDAEWPLFGGELTTHGLQVLWPKKAAQQIRMPGNLGAESVEQIFRALAAALPPA